MNDIDELKRDFYCTYSVKETPGGKSIITIESSWKGKTPGVEKVAVYLSGIDSVSGKDIPEDKARVEFTAVNTIGRTGAVDFCGDYQLHFDAYLEGGELVRDFQEPISIKLDSPSGRPYILYFTEKAPKGWTAIEIESNCWRRCSGKLWVQFNDRTQLLPPFKSNTMRCLLPIYHKEFTIVTTDPSLPMPEKLRKED